MALHTAVARSDVTVVNAMKITQTMTKLYFLQTIVF